MAGYSGAAEGPMPAPGPRLAHRNRQVIANRQRWPDGALAECERLDRAFPGWSVTWSAGNRIPGFERPPGFYAYEYPSTGRRQRVMYAATGELLAEVLTQTTPTQPSKEETNDRS